MEEKPDLVDLVGAVFRRRTFNVESLTIGQMEQPGVSCVPIVVDGHHTDLEKALRHLHRLARVIKAQTRNRGRPDAMQRADTFSARMIDAGLDTLIAGVTNTDTKIKGMFAVPETIGARRVLKNPFVCRIRTLCDAKSALARTSRGEIGICHRWEEDS